MKLRKLDDQWIPDLQREEISEVYKWIGDSWREIKISLIISGFVEDRIIDKSADLAVNSDDDSDSDASDKIDSELFVRFC